MRQLYSFEEDNLRCLTENSVSLTLIEPTKIGLKKYILDATGPVRNYFVTNNLHDFSEQLQGPNHKVYIQSLIYNKSSVTPSRTSLYRPNSKQGDPRIWFSNLPKHAKPNDLLALIYFEGKIHVINITQYSVYDLLHDYKTSPIKELILEINGLSNIIANELLFKLKRIARNPIESLLKADTSVGRTLETALGIGINSSKLPDYKGIELKSFRAKKGNRKTLFAQVANWKLSKFKSSAEILDNFGYWRKNDFKLNCTVSALTNNSQGLGLRIDSDINRLIESSNILEIGDFAVWTLEKLHNRLLEKHKETFWVSADCIKENGKEYFHYKKVKHTKKPILSQFDLLLEQGIITLDHLIKRNSKGHVKERGPLFKIKPNSLDLLFPQSSSYNL